MAKREAGTPATTRLTELGIDYTSHAYDHDPNERSFGIEAARALGFDPDQVFKTLLAVVDEQVTVAIVPVSRMLDLKALAAARSARRAELADPKAAERITGYVVGGISPIGQKRALPTVLDELALLYDTIYVSGGKRGFDIGLTPADLVRATDAQVAAISRSA